MVPNAFPGDRTRQTRAIQDELRRRGLQRLAILVGMFILFPLGLVAGMLLMRGVQTVMPPPSSVAHVLPTATALPTASPTPTPTRVVLPTVTSVPVVSGTTWHGVPRYPRARRYEDVSAAATTFVTADDIDVVDAWYRREWARAGLLFVLDYPHGGYLYHVYERSGARYAYSLTTVPGGITGIAMLDFR